jgi:hypothetical protein
MLRSPATHSSKGDNDDVFVGHNVSFITDKYPRSRIPGAQTEADGAVVPTLVKKGAPIGTATILCGVSIGENSLWSRGVVTRMSLPIRLLPVFLRIKRLEFLHRVLPLFFLHSPIYYVAASATAARCILGL